jgi:hypothetical protein
MAWNPSPEVAVAREAAKKLDAPQCIVLWINRDGTRLGMASYGETKALCAEAGKIGTAAHKAAMQAEIERREREGI